MAELAAIPHPQEKIMLETAAERYLRQVEVVRGRRETTVRDYRSIMLRLTGRASQALTRTSVFSPTRS